MGDGRIDGHHPSPAVNFFGSPIMSEFFAHYKDYPALFE
jgi:hypothetical protein